MAEHSRRAMVCGKECFAPEGDYFVTCSFDSNHVLLRSRMPYHIVKCIKNHPNHNKMQCPYDATEYIDKENYANHLFICDSRRSSERDKFNKALLQAQGLLCKLDQPPKAKALIPESDELWNAPCEKEEDTLISDDDADEECYNKPVGRGIQRPKRTPSPPKKSAGRGEILRRLIAERKLQLSGSSSSSSTTSSSKSDITFGQFDDY